MFLEVSEIKYFFWNLGSCCHVTTWPQRADEMKSTLEGSFGGFSMTGNTLEASRSSQRPTDNAELMKVSEPKRLRSEAETSTGARPVAPGGRSWFLRARPHLHPLCGRLKITLLVVTLLIMVAHDVHVSARDLLQHLRVGAGGRLIHMHLT